MTIDIVTPTKRLVEGALAESVILPGTRGQLQVLPGHADMLAMLGTGVLKLITDGGTRTFAISYGFADISKGKVTVLAETAEEANEIDKSRAVAAQKKAEEALAHTLTDENLKKYQLKLQRAVVRQQVSH